MKPANYITNEEESCPICGHPGVTEETYGFKYRHTVKEPLTVQPSPKETPETDSFEDQFGAYNASAFATLARTLESQRDEAREQLAKLQEDLQRAYEDRNRARMKEEQKWRPQLDDQRAKTRKMHRRAQNAEGQTCQFRRLFDKWKSISEFWHREFLRHHGPVELKVAQSKIAEGDQIKKMCRFLADENKRCQLLLEATNADNARLRAVIQERVDAIKEYRSDPGITCLRAGMADEALEQALTTPPPNQIVP